MQSRNLRFQRRQAVKQPEMELAFLFRIIMKRSGSFATVQPVKQAGLTFVHDILYGSQKPKERVMTVEEPKKRVPVVEYPPQNARTIPLWAPFHVKLDENYEYVPKSRIRRYFSYFWKQVITGIASIYCRIFFGFRLEGRQNLHKIKGGVVTVSNHIHVLDIAMVVQAISPRNIFVPTVKTNLGIFLLRHVIKGLGGVPIPDKPNAYKAFNEQMTRLLTKGRVVHIYPEGILYPYYTKGIRRFRRGAFKMAYDANVPIVPMVFTFRKSKGLRRITNKCPLLTLHVLEPVYPDTEKPSKEEVNRLTDHCFNLIFDFFEEHSEPMEISTR